MTINKLLAVAALGLIGCGDNQKIPDAAIQPDATPAAPTLGAQIDRMGRPAVNTVLNNGFNPDATTREPAKDAYNTAGRATWGNFVPEFMKNLAMIDVLDLNPAVAGSGCGNQALYTPDSNGQPTATSYGGLATLLSNDQVFLNTNRGSCQYYLAVEFAFQLGGASAMSDTCGGRAPTYDVVDFSYSMLAAGTAGFDLTAQPIAPKIRDNAPAHTNYLADFPYLGNPTP